jgi:hypothetical protein
MPGFRAIHFRAQGQGPESPYFDRQGIGLLRFQPFTETVQDRLGLLLANPQADHLVLQVTDPPLPLSAKVSAAPIRKRSESSHGVSLEGL